MGAQVRRFKSAALGLKELEPFVRFPQHLYTGRPFEGLGGMLPREALANWLLCAALNSEREHPLSFTSDPSTGDGLIHDEADRVQWQTEHVFVPKAQPGDLRDIDALILTAVSAKSPKGGAASASGKLLVILIESGLGGWEPNGVARQLPAVDFDDVWAIGLHGVVDGDYLYVVTLLRLYPDSAPTWLVRIRGEFEGWEVLRLQ